MARVTHGNYEFSERQEHALGQLVVDSWGSNMQTGFDDNGTPYLAVKRSPTDPVRFYSIDPDGTVVLDSGAISVRKEN